MKGSGFADFANAMYSFIRCFTGCLLAFDILFDMKDQLFAWMIFAQVNSRESY